jgi:hypothetical protein
MANLDALKQKYQPVIDLAAKRGVAWKNVHIENEKLLIRGAERRRQERGVDRDQGGRPCVRRPDG